MKLKLLFHNLVTIIITMIINPQTLECITRWRFSFGDAAGSFRVFKQ